jgi:hypothetical protein
MLETDADALKKKGTEFCCLIYFKKYGVHIALYSLFIEEEYIGFQG